MNQSSSDVSKNHEQISLKTPFALAFLWLLLLARAQPAIASPPIPSPEPAAAGTILSAVKISDAAGGFSAGELENGDNFGHRVAPIGDIDGDGVPDVAVQAINDDDGAANVGAMYILFMQRNGTVKHF